MLEGLIGEYNYVILKLKDMIPQNMRNPLQAFIINKVLIYNYEGLNKSPYYTLGQFADLKCKSLLQFKNPFQEGVNANFLTMITYESYDGKNITLATAITGFKWIKAVYENDLIVGISDTTITGNIGIKGQNAKY